MVDLKAFDDLLDRTVRAPRLSGTKVGELRDMAKQLAPQHGGDIVDILTKTNASLQPASTSRISSLYVFDAIARAAKSDAALLGKMEASVGGFVDSIIDNGKGGVWSEGRDKTRKIVDIWRKSQTFSDACIADLQGKIAGGDDRRPNVRSTTPPGAPPPHILARYKGLYTGSETQSPAGSRSPPPAPGQLPPEIMAMLGVKSKADEKAETASAIDAVLANVRGSSTATPPPGSAPVAPVPSFDPAQLAALANIAAITGTPTPPPAAPPAAAPPQQSYQQGGQGGQGQGQYGRRRSRSPERRDERDRDRGDRGDRRWRDDDRGYRDGSRDRYYHDRRDSRDRDYRDDRRDSRDMRDGRDGYSHDRRDSRDDRRDSRDDRGRDTRRDDRRDGRDGREGGRPIDRGGARLPPKPAGLAGLPPNPTLPSRPDGLPSRPADSPPTRRRDFSQDGYGRGRNSQDRNHGDRHGDRNYDRGHGGGSSYGGGQGGSGGGSGQGSGGGQGGHGGQGGSGQGGSGATLATFDLQSFNPATPESWSALAQAWQNTTGRQPNQFELMQFLATGQTPDSGASGSGGDGEGSSSGGMGGGGMGFGMPGMGMMGMGSMGMGGRMGMGGMGGGMGGMNGE